MIRQFASFSGIKLSQAAVEQRLHILPGQAGDMEQAIDIGMFCMNRPCKYSPRRVVPGANRVRRRAHSRASVPAKVEQGQQRSWLRRDARPDPRGDLPQSHFPFPPPYEPVTHDSFDEGGREIRRSVENGVASVPRAEARIRGAGSQRRRPVVLRHDPVAVRKLRLQQYRLDPVPGITGTAHEKVPLT